MKSFKNNEKRIRNTPWLKTYCNIKTLDQILTVTKVIKF